MHSFDVLLVRTVSRRSMLCPSTCVPSTVFRSAPRLYASDSGVCPVCSSVFSTRLRLIGHLSEKRERHGRAPCFPQVVPSMMLEDSEVRRLDELDKVARREARRRGRTQPLSQGPALRKRHMPQEPEAQPKRRRLREKTIVPL